MFVKKSLVLVMSMVIALLAAASPTTADVFVGVGFAGGHGHHPPCRVYPYHHYGHPHYYRGPVVVYEPAPVIVERQVVVAEPAPVVVEKTVVVEKPAPVIVREPAPVIVQSVNVYTSPQQQAMDKAIRGNDSDRRAAAEDLAQYSNVAAVATLIDVLINDSSEDVRKAAAESLGKIGDPSAYEPLMRSADAESNDDLRKASRNAARAIEDKVGADKLSVSSPMPPMNKGEEKLGEYLEDLRFGPAGTREKAAEKLGKCSGTQPVAALINALINDRKKDVREEAAKSLGKIGDRMAIPFLNVAKQTDEKDDVRDKAKKAEEKIREKIN